MAKVLKHKVFLTLLGKSKQKRRRNMLISLANNGELKAIIECIINVLYGNVPLKKEDHSKLKRFKKSMRQVVRKAEPMKYKREILQQKGGFLGSLIPIALTALTSLYPK